MSFQKLQWLFPFAVALHNTEEAFQMPGWVAAHNRQLPVHPGPAKIQIALLVLTAATFVITFLSARNGKLSASAYVLFGFVAAMLLNVLAPHIPAMVFFHGYTPGTVTAILINLPLMSFLLLKALRERWVYGRKAVGYAVLVPLVLSGAVAALFSSRF